MSVELNKIYQGNSLDVLKTFDDESIDCVVTSPPYWALRDYGCDNQLGLEPTFQEYINRLCDIFDEVKRVLKKTGTCWVNMGDTYGTKSGSAFENDNLSGKNKEDVSNTTGINKANELRGTSKEMHKSLLQIPSRFAIEMSNRGWILRNKIIWHKPSCMPSSASDRFTVDFEEVFFFVKSTKYYFKQIKTPIKQQSIERAKEIYTGKFAENNKTAIGIKTKKGNSERFAPSTGANMRTTWSIMFEPISDAHFATYPRKLIRPMIDAGCPVNGIVLDIFMGSGTTAIEALHQDKKFIGIELNPKYIKIANKRILPYLQQTKLF